MSKSIPVITTKQRSTYQRSNIAKILRCWDFGKSPIVSSTVYTLLSLLHIAARQAEDRHIITNQTETSAINKISIMQIYSTKHTWRNSIMFASVTSNPVIWQVILKYSQDSLILIIVTEWQEHSPALESLKNKTHIHSFFWFKCILIFHIYSWIAAKFIAFTGLQN